MEKLLLATKNAKKVKEMRAILQGAGVSLDVVSAVDFPEIPEPDETGETFEANAILKAEYYSRHSGLAALADDSGLVVDALDGRPGVHSSRYAPTDAERISRLLREMDEVPEPRRTARFRCIMALVKDGEVVAITDGALEGSIGHESRGQYGFGYDPVFEVAELNCTLAEAAPEQKNAISHRGRALEAMLPHLKQLAS